MTNKRRDLHKSIMRLAHCELESTVLTPNTFNTCMLSSLLSSFPPFCILPCAVSAQMPKLLISFRQNKIHCDTLSQSLVLDFCHRKDCRKCLSMLALSVVSLNTPAASDESTEAKLLCQHVHWSLLQTTTLLQVKESEAHVGVPSAQMKRDVLGTARYALVACRLVVKAALEE